MSVEVRVLKASSGDCIWIRYGKNKKSNIIIDAGTKSFYINFKKVLKRIEDNKEKVDLLIITHSDGDHIGALSKWIAHKGNSESIFKKVWFNDGNEIKKSVAKYKAEGKDFSTYINSINQTYTVGDGIKIIDYFANKDVQVESLIYTGYEEIIGEAKLRVLSPSYRELEQLILNWCVTNKNKAYFGSGDNNENLSDLIGENDFLPDDNIFNRASITFVLEHNYEGEDKKLVFLADASSETVIEGKHKVYGKDPIQVSFIKLPHHGSSRNTNAELAKEFLTNKFIVSTNGSKGKPNKKTIARLLKCNISTGIELYSNYDWWTGKDKFTKDDYEKVIDKGLLNRIKLESKLILIESGVEIGND